MLRVEMYVAAVWLLCVCAAAAQSEDEMMPGIRRNAATSWVSGRRRRPVKVSEDDNYDAMPANFAFLHRSWQREDAHQLNDIAPTDSDAFPGALLRNDVSVNEVAPVVFPDDVTGPGGGLPLAKRGDVEETEAGMSVNLNEMSMSEQLMMSQVNNVEDFARMLGVPLPPSGGATVAASTAGDGGIAARFGGAGDDALQTANHANCTPERKTVPLKLQPELNVVFFPTCVRLQRCGGCCTGPLLKCRPTDVRTVQLKVLKVEQKQEEPQGRSADVFDVSSRRRRPKPEGARRRREPISTYVVVEEEEHLNCSCQCRVQEGDCNPAIHDYVANECMCACKNQDEQGKCEQKSDTHYWHKDDCMCYCYHEETCSTGQIFDHLSCSCKNGDLRFRSGLSVRRGSEVSAPVSFPAP